MRPGRIPFLVLVMVLSLLGQTALAAAAPLDPPYQCGGVAAYEGGGQYLAQGVYARTRMYAKQSPQDGEWVNSVLARKDTGDFVEGGWYWRPATSWRVWFAAIKKGSYYYEDWLDVGEYPTDSWVGVHVRRDSPTNDTYNIYVDGVIKYAFAYTGMTSCRAHVSSERYDTLDHNKGAWLNVQAMRLNNGKFEWVYWPDAARVTWLPYMDPTYRFYYNYVDRSDHYVYNDDHQN